MGLMEPFLPDFDKDNAKIFDCHIFSFKLFIAESDFGSNMILDIALEYSNTREPDGRYRLTVNVWAKKSNKPLCSYIYTINILSDEEVSFDNYVDRIYELMRSDQLCHDNLARLVEAVQSMEDDEKAAFREHMNCICKAQFDEVLQPIEDDKADSEDEE